MITPVHNTRPYLDAWFSSLLGQSAGALRIEVIAVDDGSHDGSAAELERLAALHPGLLTVRALPRRRGPAHARNLGLGLAKGRYLFFLDSDDYLGSEALGRMVAAADKHGADVVLGRVVGVNGRWVPTFACRRTDHDVRFPTRTWPGRSPFEAVPPRPGHRAPVEVPRGAPRLQRRPVRAGGVLPGPADLGAGRLRLLLPGGPGRPRQHHLQLHPGRPAARDRRRDRGHRPLRTAGRRPGPGQLPASARRSGQSVPGRVPGTGPARAAGAVRRRAALVREHLTDAILGWCNEAQRLKLHCLRHGLLDELVALVRYEVEHQAMPGAFDITAAAWSAADGAPALELRTRQPLGLPWLGGAPVARALTGAGGRTAAARSRSRRPPPPGATPARYGSRCVRCSPGPGGAARQVPGGPCDWRPTTPAAWSASRYRPAGSCRRCAGGTRAAPIAPTRCARRTVHWSWRSPRSACAGCWRCGSGGSGRSERPARRRRGTGGPVRPGPLGLARSG
ncbi:glycosyltransferase family 2 protein [Streptacidiphilus sp. 4-A2]|nr:glycosyltransferase family 2 protein [Streptacidiphilus sp. 4-A2]